MGKSKISVVMPVFNGERYLSESIESILTQSYTNFELIIINDGSIDSTAKIIRKYMNEDDRIVLIERKNKGLVESLNDGIRMASGEYIARMDADDISEKNRFYEQIAYMEANSFDIVGTYIEVIGNCENEKRIYKWFNSNWKDSEMVDRSLEGSIIAHPTAMIKTKVLKELNGYRSDYRALEDDDLWVRAIKAGYRIGVVDKKLLKYRVHEESKTISDASKTINFYKERIGWKLEHFYNNNFEKDIYIWGCGEGGSILFDYFSERSIKVKGFMDSYKEGNFRGLPICKINVLDEENDTFIFIATIQGLHAVKKILDDRKYEKYLFVI